MAASDEAREAVYAGDLVRLRAIVERASFSRDELLKLAGHAANSGNMAILKWLVEERRVPLDDPKYTGDGALSRAHDVEIAQYLIRRGAIVRGERGKEALTSAVLAGNLPLVRFLVAKGVDAKAGVHTYVANEEHFDGWVASLRFLVSKGASLDARDDLGDTLMDRASSVKRADAIDALLALGASPVGEAAPPRVDASSVAAFVASMNLAPSSSLGLRMIGPSRIENECAYYVESGSFGFLPFASDANGDAFALRPIPKKPLLAWPVVRVFHDAAGARTLAPRLSAFVPRKDRELRDFFGDAPKAPSRARVARTPRALLLADAFYDCNPKSLKRTVKAVSTGELADVARALRADSTDEPYDGKAHVALARALEKRGRFEDAFAAYHSAAYFGSREGETPPAGCLRGARRAARAMGDRLFIEVMALFRDE